MGGGRWHSLLGSGSLRSGSSQLARMVRWFAGNSAGAPDEWLGPTRWRQHKLSELASISWCSLALTHWEAGAEGRDFALS